MAQVELQEFKTLDGKPVLTEAARRDGVGKFIAVEYVHAQDPGWKQNIAGEKSFRGPVDVSHGGTFIVYGTASYPATSVASGGVTVAKEEDITTQYKDDSIVRTLQGVEGTKTINLPNIDGTLALISDIPTNHVTVDTNQTITGNKTFTGSVSVNNSILVDSGSTQLGYADYGATNITKVTGSSIANINLPLNSGTLALTSDIPTNISSFTNDAGYTTNTGTVTSVTVKAGTGLVSSSTSAITGAGTRTISISPAYKLPTQIEWASVSHPGDKQVIVQHVGKYLNSVTGGRFRVAYYSNTSAELQYSDWLYPKGSGSGTTSSATIYCSIFKIEPEGSSSSVTLPSGCLKGATNNTLYTGGASLSKNTWYLPCSLANVWADSSMDRLDNIKD